MLAIESNLHKNENLAGQWHTSRSSRSAQSIVNNIENLCVLVSMFFLEKGGAKTYMDNV